MKKTLGFGLALALLLAAPAMASPMCSGTFSLPREHYSETEINEYNLRMLQSYGVEAESAEIWGGCIRAWVRQPDGSVDMEFYEPLNFRRVG